MNFDIIKILYEKNEETMFIAGSLLTPDQIYYAIKNAIILGNKKEINIDFQKFYNSIEYMMLNPDEKELEKPSFNEWCVIKEISKKYYNSHSFTLSLLTTNIKKSLHIDKMLCQFINERNVEEILEKICVINTLSKKNKRLMKNTDQKFFSCIKLQMSSLNNSVIYFGLKHLKQKTN